MKFMKASHAVHLQTQTVQIVDKGHGNERAKD
jgi:hypothetical protein